MKKEKPAEVEPSDVAGADESFVYLFVRAAPRIKLWPQPELPVKGKKAKKQALEEPVTICGKFFNGIPRGEPVDEEATKADRDLPKDPNSLAFSLRAEQCPGEPIFFGHSGYGTYYVLVPIYIVARIILSWYSKTVMMEAGDDDIAEELRKIRKGISSIFSTGLTYLSGHKVYSAPEKKKK